MNDKLKEKCELLAKAKESAMKGLKCRSGALGALAGDIYVTANAEPSEQTIAHCREIIKTSHCFLNELRMNVQLPVACKMAIQDNPKYYLMNVEQCFSKLHQKPMVSHEYQVVAAIVLADELVKDDFDDYAEKTKMIYERMRNGYKWITSDEDFSFASTLAVHDIELNKFFEVMNADYSIIKGVLKNTKIAMTLSHIVALKLDESHEKCKKLLDFIEAMKKAGQKFLSGYEFVMVSPFVLIDAPFEEIITNIVDCNNYLKQLGGFGVFSLSASEKLMHTCKLVIEHYKDEYEGEEKDLLEMMIKSSYYHYMSCAIKAHART